MSLIHCRECAAQISDKAPACPKCGYAPKGTFDDRHPPGRPPTADQIEPLGKVRLSRFWRRLLYAMAIVAWLLWPWMQIGNTPDAQERYLARQTIEECDKIAAGTDNIHAHGVCEKMKTDFTSKYGVAP